MAQGSGGYGGPNFSGIENDLRNIAIQFTSILQIQMQLKASVDAWRTLERELALTQAAAGGTSSEFLKMEVAARNFALSTTYTAGQVANAFYSLASAGLNVNQTMAAASGVILLAQATLTDLGEAADVVSSTLAQFNLQATDSYRVSNLFVAATNSSLATVPKLAFALRQVGPIAAQMNMSLEQTVGILDKLFDAGLRGEQAGTALRNAISRIVDPAGVGRALLQNLNIDTLDNQTGKVRNFIAIMKDLSKQNLSVGDISNIAGVEAASGFTVLLKELRENVNMTDTELEAHIATITGTNAAYKQSVIQMQTLDGQMSLMGNAFNDMRIQAGQMLAPVIGSLASTIVGLADGLKELDAATKLTFLSQALLGIEFIATAKLLGLVGMAIGPVIKNFALLKEAMIAYRAAVIASGIASAAASTQFAAMSASLVPIIGAVAGIVGVAIAIGFIEAAVRKTAEAARQARLDEVLGNVYAKGADRDKLKPVEKARVMDQRDYSGAADDQFRNLNLSTPIDAETGAGAQAKAQMLRELLNSRQEDAVDIKRKLQYLDRDYAELEGLFKKNEDKLSDMLGQGLGGQIMGSSIDEIMGVAAKNYFFSTGSDAAQAEARKATTVVTTSLNEIANASSRDLKAAFINFGARMKANLDSVVTDPVENKRITTKIEEFVTNANGMSPEMMLILQEKIKANYKKQEEALRTVADPQQRALIVRNLWDDVFEQVRDSMVVDPAGLEERRTRLKQELDAIQSRSKEAGAAISALSGNIALETAYNITSQADLTGEQKAELMNYVQGQLAQKGGGSLQSFIKAVEDAKTPRDQLIEQFKNILITYKKEYGSKLTAAATQALNTAIIPDEVLNKMERENRENMIRAQIRLIEATTGTDTSELKRRLNAVQSDNAGTNAVGEFLDLAGKMSPDTAQQLKEFRNVGSNISSIEGMFNAAAKEEEGSANQKRIQDAIYETLRSKSIVRDTPNIRRGIAAAVVKLQIDRKGLSADLAQGLKQSERAAVQLTPTQESQKALLDLPTPEEMYLSQRRLELSAEKQLSDYLNLPMVGINNAMDAAELDFRERTLAFQKKYRTFFTNNIAKGLGEAVTSPEMQDAMSGRLLANAIQTGSTTFNGETFTREALKTTDGYQAFMDTIITQFTKLTGNAPNATERIEQARRMLQGLGSEYSGMIDEFGAMTQVWELKRRDAQTKIDDFMNKFNAQSMIDRLTQAIRNNMLPGGEQTEITIDLAVRASVARVEIDGQEAMAKMRDNFQEFFRNANIPVSFNPQTQRFELVKAANVIDPAERAAQALTTSATNLNVAAGRLAGIPAMLAAGAAREAAGGSSNDNASRTSVSMGDSTRDGIARLVFDFFKGKGLNANFGTGFLGTLYGESGLNPNAVNNKPYTDDKGVYHPNGSGAFGLAQHLGPRLGELRNFASANELGVNDPQAQLSFIWKEFQTKERAAFRKMLAASQISATAVTEASTWAFERPGRKEGTASMPKRYAATNRYARMFGGQTTSAGEAAAPGTETFAPVTADTRPAVPEAVRVKAEAVALMQLYIVNQQIAAQEAYNNKVAEFVRNNPVIGLAAAVEQAGKEYDDMAGRIAASEKIFAGVAKQAAEIRVANTVNAASRMGANVTLAGPAIAQAMAEQEVAKLVEEQVDARERARRTMLLDKRTAEEIAAVEAEINGYYAERISMAGQSVASRRAVLTAQVGARQAGAEADGLNTEQDIYAGAKAATQQFASEIPTYFETASAVSIQAMQGIAGVMANIMTTGGKGIKGMIANMLSSMANLIANMLAQYAVMQLIAMLPGGTALLKAMDAAASVSSVIQMGVSVGKTVNDAASKGDKNYAEGGIHSPATRAQLMDGGIRAPGNSSRAVFGEGQYPEAFIPMIDRRTVPVEFGRDGMPYIPLPSGERIPVTVNQYGNDNHKEENNDNTYFAQGGVANAKRADNVIPYTPQRAAMADRVINPGSGDAVSVVRSGGAASQTIMNHTDLGGISVVIQGNATKDDGNAIADQIMERVMAALDERDRSNSHQQMRRGNTVQSDYYRGGF